MRRTVPAGEGPGLGRALACAAFLAFFLGPFAWQLLTSLRPEGELTRAGLPSHLTLASYASVLAGGAFLRAVANSLVLAAATTLFCLAVGASAAFALAKLRFPGSGLLLALALGVSMFPPIATVSPLYLLLRAVGLRDRLLGLVLPYATFALPLTLWLLTSFFRELPDALYRAARVDGCTPFGAFWRVLRRSRRRGSPPPGCSSSSSAGTSSSTPSPSSAPRSGARCRWP